MRLVGTMKNMDGRLSIGGCDAGELLARYGSPLYVYDEAFIRAQCVAVREALAEYTYGARAYFASKAFPNAAVEKIVSSEGMGIDVASEGELRVAMLAGIPFEEIMIHGVNKTDAYLTLAIENNAGFIVIDSIDEISRIQSIAQRLNTTVKVLLRINPGVEAETHEAVRTADLDTKFGLPLESGVALRAVKEALANTRVDLRGVHCHVGSQVFKMDVFDVAAGLLLEFMRSAADLGAAMEILNLGGGFGAYYSQGDAPKEMGESVRTITRDVLKHCGLFGVKPPFLMIEPGRSIVAEGAVALYTVGVVKDIPGVNTYIVTDGGLFENPRPLLYGSVYSAFLPLRMNDKPVKQYTLSGLCCETDTVIKRVTLPEVRTGDLLAVPTSGAYQAAMAGNYQRTPKPAVILASNAGARIIQRRQTIGEVLALDVL